MSEAEYMEDGADYLEEGCQRQTCDGCMAYNYWQQVRTLCMFCETCRSMV